MASRVEESYRLNLLIDLARICSPPVIISGLLSFVFPPVWHDGFFLRSLWHVLISVAYWTINIRHTEWKNHREAKNLGAVYIPKLKGKWQGNLDIVLSYGFFTLLPLTLTHRVIVRSRLTRTYEEGYAMENFEQFFGDSDTYNLGAMWTDKYITRNHRIMEALLATKFDSFWKGGEIKSMWDNCFRSLRTMFSLLYPICLQQVFRIIWRRNTHVQRCRREGAESFIATLLWYLQRNHLGVFIHPP